ncbi:MAG: hypothetical protein ACRESK_03490 [Gammaproteobacteria bacterium]
MIKPAIHDTSAAVSGYVQLTLGRTRLLFPRTELLSLEAQPEISSAGYHDGSVGTVHLRNAILQLYNFDEQLQLLQEAQEERRACACLGNAGKALGILCDKAELVDGMGMQVVPLPACMKTANTPVQALAMHGTRVLCVCGMEGMAGLINALIAGDKP